MYGTETQKKCYKNIYIKKSVSCLSPGCCDIVTRIYQSDCLAQCYCWHSKVAGHTLSRVVWKLRRGDLVQFLSCLSLMFIIYCLFIFIACNYKRLSLRCASVDLKLFIAFIVSIMTTILSQSIDYFVKLIQLPIIFALAFLCFWMS